MSGKLDRLGECQGSEICTAEQKNMVRQCEYYLSKESKC